MVCVVVDLVKGLGSAWMSKVMFCRRFLLVAVASQLHNASLSAQGRHTRPRGH